MVTTLILALGFFIIVIDIQTHTIPHLLSLALLLLLAIDLRSPGLTLGFIEFLSLLLFTALTRLGGGDVKLILVLIATRGEILATPIFFNGFLVVSVISLLVGAFRTSSFTGSIPMAPAILLPFLAAHLAI